MIDSNIWLLWMAVTFVVTAILYFCYVSHLLRGESVVVAYRAEIERHFWINGIGKI